MSGVFFMEIKEVKSLRQADSISVVMDSILVITDSISIATDSIWTPTDSIAKIWK